jgi:hypothetical protein
MLNIKEIDIVVASREMELRFEDGRTETFLVRVGMPYEYGDGFDWCCPYEIGTESNRKLRGIFGTSSRTGNEDNQSGNRILGKIPNRRRRPEDMNVDTHSPAAP